MVIGATTIGGTTVVAPCCWMGSACRDRNELEHQPTGSSYVSDTALF